MWIFRYLNPIKYRELLEIDSEIKTPMIIQALSARTCACTPNQGSRLMSENDMKLIDCCKFSLTCWNTFHEFYIESWGLKKTFMQIQAACCYNRNLLRLCVFNPSALVWILWWLNEISRTAHIHHLDLALALWFKVWEGGLWSMAWEAYSYNSYEGYLQCLVS